MKEIIEKTSNIKEKRSEYLYLLWYLVSNNFVTYDRSKQLNINTIIETNNE